MAGVRGKRRLFVEEYLSCWNASEAARRAGYRCPYQQGPRLLGNVGIQEAIKARIAERAMKADEILARVADQARADIGAFFKVTEVWLQHPRATQLVLASREQTLTKPNGEAVSVIEYQVRQVGLDVDKLLDARYSHLVKRFTDGPRGLSIEMYDSQRALELLGKNAQLFADRLELTGKDGAPLFDLAEWERQRDARHAAALKLLSENQGSADVSPE